MASNVIVEEEMELSGDSTVEYLGSSMEYESDGSSEYPSSVMSSSKGDSDDSDGTGEDCSADKLLDRYTFSLLQLVAIQGIVSLPIIGLRNMFACSLVSFLRKLLLTLTSMVEQSFL